MPGRRCWYLAAVAGCTVFYLCYQRWLSWILLVCVLGLPWFSLLISLPGILSFHARVECPDRVTQGHDAQAVLLGGSRFPVPLFRGYLRMEHRPSGESRTHRYSAKVSTAHCGCVTVTPEKLYVSDYLGLFRFRVRGTAPKKMVIRPVPLKMDRMPDLEHLLSRAWRPKPGGGFSENHELRLYRPGDSLNQIHWKLTAKLGKPIIREPMVPQQLRLLVTVDITGGPEELDRKFGRLLWLMGQLLERGAAFQLMALTAEGVVTFPVAREAEAAAALDALLDAGPAETGSMLEHTLQASWHCHIGGEPDGT